MFIAKNIQELKAFVQLLNKQLQIQKNTHFSLKITSWANITRERTTIEKQRLKSSLLSLCKRRKVMIKDSRQKKNKKDTKKNCWAAEQIFQKIKNVSADQRDLIVSLCKLSSDDIALYAVSSETRANLKKS